MEKVKKIIKNNVKVLVGIIIGTMVTGTGVYAATVINASDVSFKNASSGMTSTNVQGAIEELYNDSKKNLDFIDETVGTYFAHDVFASYYPDPCLKGNLCAWGKVGLGSVMSSCISEAVAKCKSECTDDTTVCNNVCGNNINNTYTPECYTKNCGKASTVMVNLANGCSEKCSGNDTCYESCFRKAVGNDTCSDTYLSNK